MRGCAGFLFAVALGAQQPTPVQTIRGTLVDQDSGPTGNLSVRAGDHRVHCFRYDDGTAVEDDGWKTSVRQLKPGDTVEVVAVPGPNPRLGYARAVRVLARAERVRARRGGAGARAADPLAELFPRGNLTLAGVIKRLHPGRMVLGTRTQGETEVLLRDDTRYLGEGREAGFAELSVNERVFVRAGRNLEDNLEAYQVMWGGILTPRRGEGSAARTAKPRESSEAVPESVFPERSQLLY